MYDTECPVCVPVNKTVGLAPIRSLVRCSLEEITISSVDSAAIMTIINELGHNILRHAGRGKICFAVIGHGERLGIRITAEDSGSGIPDLAMALKPGFSRDDGLGLGLPGIRNMADDVRIASLVSGGGTFIEVLKWLS